MAKKPWMRQLPGETVRQMNSRLAKTCYGCGERFSNARKTDEHEQICSKTTEGQRKKS